tara:strand:- start:73 stop:1950 length:1878 start_codon:yes stop_codon:yes gene_type:complete
MCSICGVFSLKNSVKNLDVIIKSMGEKISHRGPDGCGRWIDIDNKFGIVHNRLRVVDLSDSAAQPMISDDGRYVFCLNGEIYNHIELRKLLEGEGYTFRTEHSDTEVALVAYTKWGFDFVNHIKGMYAITLFDRVTRSLALIRDPLGIKPLYYMKTDEHLVFGSEIKSILECPLSSTIIREQSIYDYLTLLAVPSPFTMFENVLKVNAGTILIITCSGNINENKFWSPEKFLSLPIHLSHDEALSQVQKMVSDSIKYRCKSDVNIATTLSGGVDSALVNAIVLEEKNDYTAYSVEMMRKSNFSEGNQSRKVSEILGISKFELLEVSSIDFDNMYDYLSELYQDCPLVTPDIVLLGQLSRKVKSDGYSVCLFGEGADELGGYPSYLNQWNDYLKYNDFLKINKEIRRSFFNERNHEEKIKLDSYIDHQINSTRHILAFTEYEKSIFWNGSSFPSTYDVIEKYMKKITIDGFDGYIRKVQNVEFNLRMPDFMLTRLDSATMAFGLEARVPFLDQDLVEFFLSLNVENKFVNMFEAKGLFKELLCNHMSSEDVYSEKLGFGNVLVPLLQTHIPLKLKAILEYDNCHPIYKYIKKSYIDSLLVKHETTQNEGFKIWVIYSLATWITFFH